MTPRARPEGGGGGACDTEAIGGSELLSSYAPPCELRATLPVWGVVLNVKKETIIETKCKNLSPASAQGRFKLRLYSYMHEIFCDTCGCQATTVERG